MDGGRIAGLPTQTPRDRQGSGTEYCPHGPAQCPRTPDGHRSGAAQRWRLRPSYLLSLITRSKLMVLSEATMTSNFQLVESPLPGDPSLTSVTCRSSQLCATRTHPFSGSTQMALGFLSPCVMSVLVKRPSRSETRMAAEPPSVQ